MCLFLREAAPRTFLGVAKTDAAGKAALNVVVALEDSQLRSGLLC